MLILKMKFFYVKIEYFKIGIGGGAGALCINYLR